MMSPQKAVLNEQTKAPALVKIAKEAGQGVPEWLEKAGKRRSLGLKGRCFWTLKGVFRCFWNTL